MKNTQVETSLYIIALVWPGDQVHCCRVTKCKTEMIPVKNVKTNDTGVTLSLAGICTRSSITERPKQSLWSGAGDGRHLSYGHEVGTNK